MKAVFISDVHLSTTGDPAYTRLLSFMDRIKKEKADCLFIVGDLFEILTGNTAYVKKRFRSLFEKFSDFTKEGGKIHYLYGNHDFNFRLDGIETRDQYSQIQIGKFKCYINHGDGLDPLDHKYIRLKKVLRSRAFEFISQYIPGSLLYAAGSFFSMLSRNSNQKNSIKQKRYTVYRNYALQKLKSSDIDVCIMGHTHIPQLVPLDCKPSVKYYLNTGSFSMSNSYGLIDDTGIYLLTI